MTVCRVMYPRTSRMVKPSTSSNTVSTIPVEAVSRLLPSTPAASSSAGAPVGIARCRVTMGTVPGSALKIFCAVSRQQDFEDGVTGTAAHRDRAGVRAHDRVDDRQPESAATGRRRAVLVTPYEPLEDVGQHGVGDPGSVVADRDDRAGRVGRAVVLVG